MSMISHVYIKDGKITDELGNNWYFGDTNSADVTGVEDPFGGNNAYHLEGNHYLICDKLNNAKDSKFVSIDFYTKVTKFCQDYGPSLFDYFWSIGPKGTGYGISLAWGGDNYLLTGNGANSNAITKLPSEDMLNKWVHIRMCIDAHNAIGKAEIKGKKTTIPGMTTLYANTLSFSTHANYIGTWTHGGRHLINTATADYYDFKLYDSDIIGWNYDSKGDCIIY